MSTHWFGVPSAEGYRAAGATTFITEMAPDATTGYDFSTLEEMLAGVTVDSEEILPVGRRRLTNAL